MERMLERLLAEIRANNKKVEVFRGPVVPWVGVHHAKTEAKS
jgi:hypothetical protein